MAYQIVFKPAQNPQAVRLVPRALRETPGTGFVGTNARRSEIAPTRKKAALREERAAFAETGV
jgi:hypothetical protein